MDATVMDRTVSVRSLAWMTVGVVAALAATLIVTQAWSADAAPGDDDSTFVPIDPCRLFDTRPAPNTVGSRTSPLGPKESYPVQVTGSNGDCVGIPADAVAVAMNVTAVGPTAQTFLAVVPSEITGTPSTSSLNVPAGSTPTPNKVDVKLGADGKIRVYNHSGKVHALADIVGYYTSSTLKELANSVPFARHISGNQSTGLTATDAVVRSVTITAPVAGTVIVQSTAGVLGSADHGEDALCSISNNTTRNPDYNQIAEPDSRGMLAGQRAFEVTAGQTLTANLVCESATATGATIFDSTMTATFYAGTNVIVSALSALDEGASPEED